MCTKYYGIESTLFLIKNPIHTSLRHIPPSTLLNLLYKFKKYGHQIKYPNQPYQKIMSVRRSKQLTLA